jgi:hypothetical protein
MSSLLGTKQGLRAQPAHIRTFRQEEAGRTFDETLQVVERFHAENGL